MLQLPGRMVQGRQAGGRMHPMFDALRNRHAQERSDYIRMMKARERKKVSGDISGYPTFDSLKLLGAENDAQYLDNFMSEGARMRHMNNMMEEVDSKQQRSRSASHASKSTTNSNSKRNSLNVNELKKTLLGSLRSTASDENIYESVEVIQYRKHMEAISRQNKVRSVPKTGHPLFDHLRVEKVLKPRRSHHHQQQQQQQQQGEAPRRGDANNSDGGSNSQSSSGSGDEFDYTRKPNTRFSRREMLMTTSNEQQPKKQTKQQKVSSSSSSRRVPDAGSESDDDWLIPRPKIFNDVRSRRTGATSLMRSSSHEESDSSSKSTGLR